MANLEILFGEIDKFHYSEACIDASEVDDFESRSGYSFPDDLKIFYRRYKSVRLFSNEGFDATYRFVPISEIHPTYIDIYGADAEERGPSTWLTICDVQDGNYIALDIASKNGSEYNYIDCFHETFAIPGACLIIAKSFTELLERALHGGQERLYYLEEGFQGHGDAMALTPENAIERIDNLEAPRQGWFVRFYQHGIVHHTYFYDSEYGGKEGSHYAAKEYVERNSG